MLQISVVFIVITMLVFGVVMLVTSPTQKENIATRRLREILRSSSGTLKATSRLNDSLVPSDPQSPGRVRSLFEGTRIMRLLQTLIFQSHVHVPVEFLLQIVSALAILACFIAWYFTGTILLSVVCGVIAGALPFTYLGYRRKKWLADFNAVLPECIETFSRSLRAGHSIVAGFDIVAQQVPAPANAEFAEVFKKQKYGLPLRDALYQMIERVPSMDLKIMITAVLVQRETGGNLPNVFDRLVLVIRDRLKIQRDIRTHTAQGRLTGWILGLLPLFLMAAINIISPNYSGPFLHDPLGKRMLYVGVAMLMSGVFIIRRIINGIEV